jgi:hypothetical protein
MVRRMYLQKRFWSLLVALGFVLSVLAVFAPAGAASGRAENFVVTVTFTNPDGSHDNSSVWTATGKVNITANVSIAGGMENVTDLKLSLKVDGDPEGTDQSLGALEAGNFTEYTWQWQPSAPGDYEIEVMAVNGTDHANHTMVTKFYKSLVPPKANLTITNLAVDKATAHVGDAVTFTVTVLNDGTADAEKITIDFSELVIIVYMSIGELENVTVPKGQTVNVTWTYTLPDITANTETKTIRAGYGEGFILTTYKMVNVTVNKKLPKLEITSFSMPAGKRVWDAAEANITVKNNGTANATGVTVKIREGSWEYTNVTDPFNLSVGENKTVKLGIFLDDEAGVDNNHTYTAVAIVGGIESKRDSTVFVAHQIYAAIGIQSFKITPAKKDNQPKDSSQSFSAVVTLKNQGEKAGSVQLMLMEGTGASAKLLSNQTVSVESLATKEVKVSFKVKGAGKHTITSAVSLPNPDTGNMTKQATCELQYSSPGFEVVVLIAAMMAGAVFVRRRKD